MRKVCLRCGSKFVSEAEYCPHDGNLLVTDHEIPDPLLGTVLLEQFRIDEQIGTGGMGTVYRAHQTTVGRDVAVKVLRKELARDEHAVARFEREGRLAIALDHPNLVRVFLTGRLTDGRLYIVMELLEGRSLADELAEVGPLPLERAVILLMKLCAALGAVHGAGVVHRDIKPENVYLVRRGKDEDFVKLVDFGIARVLRAEGVDPTTTQNGRVLGTAAYISPEAAIGEDSDYRSDIYSLGVLAYQLLTGELPFQGSTAGATLMQHVHREPPSLRHKGRGADVPDELAMVVMRCLRKDPTARQQSLAELLDSLAEAAGRAGLLNDARALLLGTVWGDDLAAPGSYLGDLLASSSPPVAPTTGPSGAGPVAFMRDPEEEALLSSAPKPFGTTAHDLVAIPGLERPRRPWLWASLGLMSIALAGVAAGAWWRQHPRQEAEHAPVITKPRQATVDDRSEVPDIGTDASMGDVGATALLMQAHEEALAEEVETKRINATPRPRAKPVTRRPASRPKQAKRRVKSATGSASVTGSRSGSATGSATGTESGTATAGGSGSGVALEADEGIDWTVPGFPEGAPPTGMPDAPARNPIVIDEPPAR